MKLTFLSFLLLLGSCLKKIETNDFLASSNDQFSNGLTTRFNINVFDSIQISSDQLGIDSSKYDSIKILKNARLGTIQSVSLDSVSYKHTVDDPNGQDQFTLVAQGPTEKVIEVNIHINGNDKSPIPLDDLISVMQGEEISINVLENDTDPTNERLVIESIITPPTLGSARIEQNKIRYTAGNLIGSDMLVYQIKNESGLIATAEVRISINENNRDPDALPLRILFIMAPGSNTQRNTYQQEANFLLNTLNDSLNSFGSQIFEYYLHSAERVEDQNCGNMNLNSYPTCIDRFGTDGVLTLIVNEDIPGGVLGVAHGIDCVIKKTGASCKSSMVGSYAVIFVENRSIRGTGGTCQNAPLGCTTTHELGHHLGYAHLSGETNQPYVYSRNECNFPSTQYFRTLGNPSYTETMSDSNGKSWHIGPHAMRKGGGTTLRNGGFFTNGYREPSEDIFECYHSTSKRNLE
jgi:hypothetical protein